MWGRWALQAPPAPEDPPDPQALTGRRAPPEASATLEPWARRASLAKLETPAFLEKGDPRDPKGSGARRASRVLLALLDLLDPKARPEMTALRAARVLSGFPVTPDPLENLALRVRTGRLATRETTGSQGRQAPRAPLGSLVPLGLQERGVPPALQDLKADKGRKEPREKLAWRGLLGRLAPSDPRVPPESRDLTACGGSLAPWVNKASLDPLALTGPPAPWVPQDSPASKEILAPKGKRVTQA